MSRGGEPNNSGSTGAVSTAIADSPRRDRAITKGSDMHDLDRPRVGYVVTLALSAIVAVGWLNRSIATAEASVKHATDQLVELRAWRLSAEQALRKCTP